MISLSDPVDPGTRIWYSATLPSDAIGYLLADIPRLLGDLTSYLASNYQITVESSNHTAGLLGASIVSLILYVNSSYGALSDVQKIIDDAFYNAGGIENRVQVQSSSITKVQYAGDSTATDTGAPGPSQQVTGSGTASGVPDPNAKSKGVLSDLWNALFGGLFTGSLSITGWVSIVAVAIFGILIVGVILSPTTPVRVARSFR